jgi:putative oxidoreductase
MWITADDFRIKADNFDLTNGMNVLRIICGAFMFPHAASKFIAGGIAPGLAGFFAKAGFQPAEVWICIAAAAEIAVGITLVLGICTRFASLGGAAVLLFAVYALQVVKGFGWTWNTGGYEYPIFWAIACLVVSVEAWKIALTHPAKTPAASAFVIPLKAY